MKVIFFLLGILLSYNGDCQTITTIGGNGATSYSGNGVPAISAGIANPRGAAFDKHGNFYFTDGSSSHQVRKIDPSGIITTVAGNGSGGFLGDGGPATAARLSYPIAIAFDSSENLYIVDGGNNRIRKVDAISRLISTIAGNGTAAYTGDGNVATSASLQNPCDIHIDVFNNIYVAGGYTIRKINSSGIISTVAGNGTYGYSGDGGQATAAQILDPQGVVVDDTGNIYIAERTGNHVRKVNVSGVISTFAGNGTASYTTDGIPAISAQIVPFKLGLHNRKLYITDDYNQRIYFIDTLSILHSIVGNGTAGFGGDGGPATAANLHLPAGLAFDPCDNLYFPDAFNHRIRKVTYSSNPTIALTSPSSATIGSTVTVTATVVNTGAGYIIKWYNKGILFNTTTTPTVTYTKAQCTDSITAKIYGCSDSATSNLKVVGCNVGVGSLQSAVGSCTVYPNPVADELNIEASELIESVVISNLLGQVVWGSGPASAKAMPGKNERHIKVPLSELPRGIYLVKVACPDVFGGRVYVERVIKE